MSRYESIIRAAEELGVTDAAVSRSFLGDELTAIRATEYCHDAIPTIFQLPPLTRAYMEAYTSEETQGIELGVAVRRARALEAPKRVNRLFLTEAAIAMQNSIDSNGAEVPLRLSAEERQAQLSHLAACALLPYVELHVLPQSTPLPVFHTIISFEQPDGQKRVYYEADGGVKGPVTDQESIDYYHAALDGLATQALSHQEAVEYMQHL